MSVELFMQNEDIQIDTDIYDTHNDLEKTTELTSSMLQSLLESTSTKFINQSVIFCSNPKYCYKHCKKLFPPKESY